MPRSRNHCRIGSCVVWLLSSRVLYTNRPFSAFVCKLAAPLRSAWSASTTKNSACCPLAVCSITHGAILVAGDTGEPLLTAPAFAEASAGRREEAIAPTAATTAATRNSEQKIRRHGDGVNADVGFGFVIIEWPVR